MIDHETTLIDLNPLENCYQLIKSGKFSEAIIGLEGNLSEGKSGEEFYNLLKQLRFWIERTERLVDEGIDKNHEIKKLHRYFHNYEYFIKKYELYQEEDYLAFKKAIFTRMIDNHIFKFNHEDKSHQEDILHLAYLLFEMKDYEKAEETLIYVRNLSNQNEYIDFLLANVFYYQNKENKALLHLKDSFFWHDYYDYQLIQIDRFYPLINELLAKNFNTLEVSLWLPVYAKLDKLLDINSMFSKTTFKLMIERVEKIKNKFENHPNQQGYYEPKLIYSYLYVLDQIKIRIQKGQKEFKDDLKVLLYKVANLNNNIYQKIKKNYE